MAVAFPHAEVRADLSATSIKCSMENQHDNNFSEPSFFYQGVRSDGYRTGASRPIGYRACRRYRGGGKVGGRLPTFAAAEYRSVAQTGRRHSNLRHWKRPGAPDQDACRKKNASRAKLDVSLLRDNDMYQMHFEKTTTPVAAKLMPNLANVAPQFRCSYSMPHIFSALLMLYSTDKVKTAPDSMNAMMDPAYKGRIGLVDDQYDYLTLAGALALGGGVKDIELGRKFLRELKKMEPKVYSSTDALAGALKTGDIWLTVSWKARALQWQKAGLAIDYVMPKEGALPAVFEAAVPMGSRNKEAAFSYLNAMLGSQGAARLCRNDGLCADDSKCGIAARPAARGWFYRLRNGASSAYRF